MDVCVCVVCVCLPRERNRAGSVCLRCIVGSCLLSLVLKVDYRSPLKRGVDKFDKQKRRRRKGSGEEEKFQPMRLLLLLRSQRLT